MGNTTTTNNKKKKSNARKLIPAIGMLMTSAAMLTTSTYAWFTMNKEVSITGITLTASVPETLEISIGDKSTANGSAAKPTQNSNTHLITVPKPDTDDDWTNTVDITDYYVTKGQIDFGRLYPASSVDGAAFFQTKTASGQGLEYTTSTIFSTAGEIADENVTDSYSRYYLDIPVWIRTTSKSNVDLSVEATISDENNKDLFKSARVVILGAEDNEDGNPSPSTSNSKIIIAKEVQGENVNSPDSDSFKNKYNFTGKAISSAGNARVDNDDNKIKPPLGDVSIMDSNYKIEVPAAGENVRAGNAVKKYIRIWLEGEDKDCYNVNAGQSFNISLKFSKIETTP